MRPNPLRELCRQLRRRWCRHYPYRGRVLKHERERVLPELHIERHRHRPGPDGPQEGLDVSDVIGPEQSDPVTWSHPLCDELIGHLVGMSLEIPVGQAQPLLDERQTIGMEAQCIVDEVAEVLDLSQQRLGAPAPRHRSGAGHPTPPAFWSTFWAKIIPRRDSQRALAPTVSQCIRRRHPRRSADLGAGRSERIWHYLVGGGRPRSTQHSGTKCSQSNRSISPDSSCQKALEMCKGHGH